MLINGKVVKLIRKSDHITIIIDDVSITMTIGEWSKLISLPEVA